MSKYLDDLREAEDTLREMLLKADFLQTSIAKQKRKIAALRELANITTDASPQADLVEGITDACRIVLRAANKALLPVEVRDQVEALGIRQENLLASVHTVLKRLLKANQVRETYPESGSGPARYKWITGGERFMDGLIAVAGHAVESQLPPELRAAISKVPEKK